MKKLLSILVFSFVMMNYVYSSPCTLVSDPQYIKFTNLKKFNKFLYKDVIYDKGIAAIVGKQIVKSKFKKIGIPDPVEEPLKYSIVLREDSTNFKKINSVIVLKGNVNYEKLVKYYNKEYKNYMGKQVKRGWKASVASISKKTINEVKANVYPFKERNSETILLNFDKFTLIAIAPNKDYSLITKTIDVLKEKIPFKSQPESFNYKIRFSPTEMEKKQIFVFESKLDEFKNKARDTYTKLMNKVGADIDPDQMKTTEEKIKEAIADLDEVIYEIKCEKDSNNYSYNVKFWGKCKDANKAQKMKEIFTEQLVKAKSSCLTEKDEEVYNYMKVQNSGEYFVFDTEISPERDQQYGFASMMITLFFQDKRFTKWFN